MPTPLNEYEQLMLRAASNICEAVFELRCGFPLPEGRMDKDFQLRRDLHDAVDTYCKKED